MKQPHSRDETLWRQDFAAKNGALASAAWLMLALSLREQGVFLSGGWRARWEGGGSLFSIGPGSHYFHVADWGMERGGIMSRRYSRWRSTAEEVLCTAKLGLTNARAPPTTEQSNMLRWLQSGRLLRGHQAQQGQLSLGAKNPSLRPKENL